MPRQGSTFRARQPVALAALGLVTLCTLASGCTQTQNWLKGRRTATPSDTVVVGAPGADVYLQELYALATGDPYTQVEIHADAESAARLTPGPSTELRLALILATPGHAETDPQRAQSMLRDVLSRTELLTAAEIALATVYLRDVEERLTLGAETRRLRASNAEAQATEAQAIAQRIATVEAENRRLRQELTEAEQKLEAITSIERSIRERTDNQN